MAAVSLPLEGKRHVLLAVSGGSDPTAMLALYFARSNPSPTAFKLTAITIELRCAPNRLQRQRWSAPCARSSALSTWCAASGLARSLRHRHSGQVARDARRTLIAEAAGHWRRPCTHREHTIDDQRETVTMRARRGLVRLHKLRPRRLFSMTLQMDNRSGLRARFW